MAVSDPSLQRMRQRLRTTEGRAWYKKRKALVEPVIGILKEQRGCDSSSAGAVGGRQSSGRSRRWPTDLSTITPCAATFDHSHRAGSNE